MCTQQRVCATSDQCYYKWSKSNGSSRKCSVRTEPESTTFKDFIEKLREEVTELENEHFTDNVAVEMADIGLVLFAMAEHYNINLISEMELKTLYNEKRND